MNKDDANKSNLYEPWQENPWKKGIPYPIPRPLPKITFDKHPCQHDSCPECHGSGIKENGQPCIHMISCSCPKCSPYMFQQ